MASSARQVIFAFILSVTFQFIDSSDLFTNPITIFELANKEFKLLQLLSHSKKTDILEKYLNKNSVQDLSESHGGIHDENIPYDERDIVANPLHVYSFFYRMFINLPKVAQLINEIKDDAITDFLNEIKVKNITQKDMVGVAFALIRIQLVYELDPYEMAMGKLGDRQTNARLSSEELYEIVKIIYYGTKRTTHHVDIEYALAITWLEGTIRLSQEDGLDDIFVEELKSLLFQIQDEHDQNFKPPVSDLNMNSTTPNEEFFIEKFNRNRSLTSRELRLKEKEYLKRYYVKSYMNQNFFSVCRGEKQAWTPHDNANQCFMKDFSNPLLLLQPARIELLNEEPLLVQVHDVLPYSWIDRMKNLSKNRFSRSLVEASKLDMSFVRTQSNVWLELNADKILPRLSLYFEAVLGMNVLITAGAIKESETYQIGVYSPGGVYLPHQDAFDEKIKEFNHENEFIGNRIATLMLYLSDIDGGGTAFTNIGKVAYPRKGSSVFWFNLLSNGEIDQRTVHGACPATYGIKWVSNLWIRSYAQIYKKQCSLIPEEKLSLF